MDAKTYSETLFGRVVDFKDVAADQAEYAKVFASGSPALEKLLRNLWDRGIQTVACGNGYDERHENFSLMTEQNIQDRYDTYLNTHGLSKWVMNRHKDDYIPKHHAYVSIDAETVSNPDKFVRTIKSAMKPYQNDCNFEVVRAQTAGKDVININMNIPRNQGCTLHELSDMSFEEALKSSLPSPTAFDRFFDAINMGVMNMAKKKQRGNLSNNSSEYQNIEFGKVVSSFDSIKADKQGYAEVFSEGSPALKNLLLHMWDNNVETLACCTGHTGVPYYTKDTLFGPKEIDQKTYNEHYGSSRYHCFVRDRAGYFAVKVDGDADKIRALSDTLKKHLADVQPELPCRVTFGNGTLGVHLNHYVRESEVERIFTHVSDAMSKTLGIPEPTKAIPREITAEERNILLKNPFHIQHMEQTPELCMFAVKINGDALKYVKEQTPEICMAAVKQNGRALQHAKVQTPELCMEAVRNDSMAIEFVKRQTPEICKQAVRYNSYAMKFVHNQTEEVCMEAVRFSGNALQHMRNPSPAVCKAAVKVDPGAMKFVPLHIAQVLGQAVGKAAKTAVQTQIRSSGGRER